MINGILFLSSNLIKIHLGYNSQYFTFFSEKRVVIREGSLNLMDS